MVSISNGRLLCDSFVRRRSTTSRGLLSFPLTVKRWGLLEDVEDVNVWLEEEDGGAEERQVVVGDFRRSAFSSTTEGNAVKLKTRDSGELKTGLKKGPYEM